MELNEGKVKQEEVKEEFRDDNPDLEIK